MVANLASTGVAANLIPAVGDEMEIPEVLHHKITYNQMYIAIDPEIEAIHLIASEWWIEEARVMIELNMESYGSQTHNLKIGSTRAMVSDLIRVRKILGTPDFCPLPNFPKSLSMKGAGNKVFKRNLREIISNHKPSIVVLMETKVQLSSMGLFFNKLGFTASTHVDPVSKCGGIWMLWDPFKATVMALDANPSPNPRSRDALWNNLESMADNISEPWLVAGDFNDFTNLNEKRRFSTNQDQVRTRKFQARLNRCRLMDLGCSGPRLTWSNGRQGMANTLERLDRAVCTTEWRLQFQEGAVRNLPRTYSDHAPVIIYTEGMQHSDPILRPFRMEAAWFVNPDFKNLVKDSWDETNNSILEVITSITAKASHWNKNVFGNIFRNKRWLLGRIEGIQKAQSQKFSHNLFVLEKELIKYYNNILYQEEIFWFQKSQSNWISLGERNTRFFHIVTLAKRRHSRISEPTDLKTHVGNYFEELFTALPEVTRIRWEHELLSKFTVDDNAELGRPLFISPNVPISKARSFSSNCGIPLTHDLGKYLGIPLLHNRVSRAHFTSIFEKLQNRLTGWKANMLSITERATLINSVTSALLAYMMQTMDLPANVCKDMDRLNKNILWGDVGTSKKIHLVNWATVCNSKKLGGLGIRKAKDSNLALLSKLGWKLLSGESCLWARIWKNRNLQIFENVDLPWQQSLYLILRYATDIKDAFNLSIVNILDNELIS
ncbi:hypothetical protein ACSBR1_029440 [Camellia fascicularis]